MFQITMRFKSGKEYNFQCESYETIRGGFTGDLINFSYEGGIGTCPVFYRIDDIESIAVLIEEENKNE